MNYNQKINKLLLECDDLLNQITRKYYNIFLLNKILF
jgi:hypothetical protein